MTSLRHKEVEWPSVIQQINDPLIPWTRFEPSLTSDPHFKLELYTQHAEIFSLICALHSKPLSLSHTHTHIHTLSRSVISYSLWLHGYSPWNSPDQNTGVGSVSHLQGIFLTQGSNPGLPQCRRILYQLSHQGNPRILEWVAYPFPRGSSPPRNQGAL